MVMPKSYDDLVERLAKEREIKGNVSSQKLTPQECREEILKATEGVIDTDREARLALAKVGINALIDEATGYEKERPKDDLKKMLAREREEGNNRLMEKIHKPAMEALKGFVGAPESITNAGNAPITICGDREVTLQPGQTLQAGSYITKSGRVYKSKPGRKPKEQK